MVGWAVGWLGGSLENWRVILISTFNYVIVEVVAEIGKTRKKPVYHGTVVHPSGMGGLICLKSM